MRFACWRFTDRRGRFRYFSGEGEHRRRRVGQGEEIEFFNISTLAQIDNAKNLTTIDAITWINHVDDNFERLVLFCRMFSAELYYGVGIRREEWVVFERRRVDFGIVLAVLSFTVAKSTYG